MAAKPTQDPKWVTSDDPNEIIEPSPALKTNGVQSGGIWGREHLNWMFNSLSKWIDWVRSFAMDKDNNLNDVANKVSAFNNIKQSATTSTTGVVELATDTETQTGSDTSRVVTPASLSSRTATTTRTGLVEKATDTETESGTSGKFPDAASIASKFLKKSDNLSTVASAFTAFNNIKQSATESLSGVVEKATLNEMSSGTANKFPDASTVKAFLPTAGLGANGYWKCNTTGLIIQWFSAISDSDDDQTFAFPIPFPNTCLQAAAFNIAGVYSFNSVSITINRQDFQDGDFSSVFLAIGY